MVANALSSFTVAIGFEADQRGEREIQGSFDRIRGAATALGSALAGAFGIKELISGFKELDQMAKTARWFDSNAQTLDALNRLYDKAGGSGSVAGQLSSLFSLIAELDKSGTLESWAKEAGLNPSALMNATTPVQLLRALSPQLQGMDNKGLQRVADATPLDRALLDVARSGLAGLQAEKDRRAMTQRQIDIAEQSNDTLTDIGTNIANQAGKASELLMDDLGGTNALNDFEHFTRDPTGYFRNLKDFYIDRPAANVINQIKVFIGDKEIDSKVEEKIQKNNAHEAQEIEPGGA